MKRYFLIALILCGMTFMGMKLEMDKIPREKVPGSSIIYIPSGKYLKYATFGFSSLAADLIYIWSIQYFSDHTVLDRFDYLDHVISVINELDPRWFDPYDIGALIAIHDARNLDIALKILDRGLEKNPTEWIYPYQAGHYVQWFVKDYKRAREYYKTAMEIEGAPPINRRLYANAAFKMMDYETSWKTWLEIYQTTDDERIKGIASNHLYQTKAAVDTQNIKAAIDLFKERYGRLPEELSQLVRYSILDSLPLDFDGKDYVYDPETGEVKAPTIPWKR
jgi:tetratricopeptide (TPR) repeat protein